MKDLFVLTADSDAEAVMRSILVRHKALGIRPIEAKVMRFAGRDSGMVKEGPEIARALVKKSEYSHLILLWDHHGSGWDNRASEWALDAIQQRLDGVTWAGRSAAIVAVPELKNGSVAANRRWQSTLGLRLLLSMHWPISARRNATYRESSTTGIIRKSFLRVCCTS